jgi:hypothetical protein
MARLAPPTKGKELMFIDAQVKIRCGECGRLIMLCLEEKISGWGFFLTETAQKDIENWTKAGVCHYCPKCWEENYKEEDCK